MTTAALIKQAQDAGIELHLVNGRINGRGKPAAVADLLPLLRQHKNALIRWFSQQAANAPEPSANPAAWRELAQAYHAHHFACKTCIAAGQGRGLRCGCGAALWTKYQEAL